MIGAARMFARRMFAPRYWPKVGAASSVAADAIGELTPDGARSYFPGSAATVATLGGGVDADDLGGSLGQSTIGGTLA